MSNIINHIGGGGTSRDEVVLFDIGEGIDITGGWTAVSSGGGSTMTKNANGWIFSHPSRTSITYDTFRPTNISQEALAWANPIIVFEFYLASGNAFNVITRDYGQSLYSLGTNNAKTSQSIRYTSGSCFGASPPANNTCSLCITKVYIYNAN